MAAPVMEETLGERIRIERARKQIRQAALAKAIGISANSMNQIESGESDPRASRIAALARVLGVSADYLLGLCEERTPREDPRHAGHAV